jgi:hypothetical protein
MTHRDVSISISERLFGSDAARFRGCIELVGNGSLTISDGYAISKKLTS